VRTTFPVAAPASAWAALADPARVAAALPGCRSAVADGDGTLVVVADVAVASVRGLWSGRVTRLDGDTVRVAGSGAPGTVDVTVRADAGRSQITVEGEVGGPLATVGGSVLAAAARQLAEDLLAGVAAAGPVPPAAALGPDLGAAVRRRGRTGAVAAAAAVGAVALVRWRRHRRRSGGPGP
jgi:carbon monoxide dehydrogenase subunit G